MATVKLGRTTANSYFQINANYKVVSRFTVGASGFTFVHGSVYSYMNGTNYAIVKTKMVVYAADGSGGAPGTLLATSNELVGFLGGQWNNYTFASAVTLSASTNYYIGIIADNTIYISAQSTGGTTSYNSDTYSDGPANPFGTRTTSVYELGAYLMAPETDIWTAKANALAVLVAPLNAASVAKAYGLAILSEESRVAVAQAYALAILAEPVVSTARPVAMVIT